MPLHNLALIRPGIRAKRISSYDRTGGNNDFVRVEAGETKTLAEVSGAGIVKHIWITLACDDPMIRRNAVLRMFWDGEANPSVEAPLGDFFGQGWGEKYLYASLPLAAAPAGGNALNCYFPMPFGDGARIEIENQSDSLIPHFYYLCRLRGASQAASGRRWAVSMPGGTGKCPAPKPDRVTGRTSGKRWASSRKTRPMSATISLSTPKAQAIMSASTISSNSPTPLWYGEGDDMFLMDGEPWPGSLHGTGTEDYFNSSWCPKELYAHPYFGYARVNGETGFLGRTHCYRFHLEDPIYFQKSLRASIEHGHANSLTLDLATVAYWYQTEPHRPFAPILPQAQRQPMPPVGPVEIHKWRDAWRREQGGGPLWGNEPLPDGTRVE